MQIYTCSTYTLYTIPVSDCKLQPLHNDCSSTIFFQSKIRKICLSLFARTPHAKLSHARYFPVKIKGLSWRKCINKNLLV